MPKEFERCAFIKPNGIRCSSYPLDGSEYCTIHCDDPQSSVARDSARREGGLAPTPLPVIDTDVPEVPLATSKDDKPGTSLKKIEANRCNAQKSSGPRTIRGKRNSRGNALKHGIFVRDVVIEGKEDPEEFHALLSELKADLQPEGRSEELIVEFVAACDWRFRRAFRAEAGEVLNGFAEEGENPLVHYTTAHRNLPDVEATAKILRYEAAIHRQKMQAMQLLEKLQRRRKPTAASSTENGISPER